MATVHSTALEPPAEPGVLAAKFAELLATIGKNRPSDDIGVIRKAWEFCVQHHSGQLRASGEPYVLHPLEVAQVLDEMKLDSTAIAAGLLHAAAENPPAPTEATTNKLGRKVA